MVGINGLRKMLVKKLIVGNAPSNKKNKNINTLFFYL